MRLVIDLQGAQSIGSRTRGIGRYSLALAKAMAAQAGSNEVWLALNGAFPETIEPIRAEFDTLLPQERIVVWSALPRTSMNDEANTWRLKTGTILREAFLANLRPDWVHVSSLFEGLEDDVVTSIGSFTSGENTAVTLYDLIPLIHKTPYLNNPVVSRWYYRKLADLRRAGLWLAISESSRREGLELLTLPADRTVNISTAAHDFFRPMAITEAQERELRQRYSLEKSFIMYTGGIDHRKNIEGLIGAFADLPPAVRDSHQLAIVCSARSEDREKLTLLAEKQGLGGKSLVVTGFVPDADLLALYNLCRVFCFPSQHEGFGLPAL
jgi:glycosyltransferase involved in cell wall biosynthesis